jgi:hypothetical protein
MEQWNIRITVLPNYRPAETRAVVSPMLSNSSPLKIPIIPVFQHSTIANDAEHLDSYFLNHLFQIDHCGLCV